MLPSSGSRKAKFLFDWIPKEELSQSLDTKRSSMYAQCTFCKHVTLMGYNRKISDKIMKDATAGGIQTTYYA